MKMNDKKKQLVLLHLSVVPIVSGQQLELFFQEYQHPKARMSTCLSELRKEGLIEGVARPIGESKVWRLTKKGRLMMNTRTPSVLLTTRNIDHYLAISSVYFHLQQSHAMGVFWCEPRFRFVNEEETEVVYAPDAFFTWKEVPYFLEVQRSPLARKKWREKWRRAEQFYDLELPRTIEGYTVTEETSIVVVSNQPETTIYDTSLHLRISPNITALFPNDEPLPKKRHTLTHLLAELTKDIDASRAFYANKDAKGLAPFSPEAFQKYDKWVKNHNLLNSKR